MNEPVRSNERPHPAPGGVQRSRGLRRRQIATAHVRAHRLSFQPACALDLTKDDKTNPLFHTGGAPNSTNATNILSHRPDEFIWRVAEGRSTGVGRAKPEAWHAFVDRMLKEHFHTRSHFTRSGGDLPVMQYGAAEHQYE